MSFDRSNPLQGAAAPAGRPLSFAQRRLWFLDRLAPQSSQYNVPLAVRLSGGLDEAALEGALNRVLQRHEILRTTYGYSPNGPFQQPQPPSFLRLDRGDLSGCSDSSDQVRLRLEEEAARSFDLSRDLMIRALLIRLAPRDQVLLITLHHIASDGLSLAVVAHEVSAFYAAAIQSGEPQIEALPAQYADFAEWHLDWLGDAALEKRLQYWRRNLEGAPDQLRLPLDRPRPTLPAFQGTTERRALSLSLVEAVRNRSHAEGMTLYVTLLAAFQALLSRFTGETDICVGAPAAGRNSFPRQWRAKTRPLIGYFANTLVLRTDLRGDPSFRELLARSLKTVMGATGHQDMPFEKLIEALQPKRALSYNPLFQVMFTLDETPSAPWSLPAVEVEPVFVSTKSSKVDLSLLISDFKGELTVALEYNTAIFDQKTAQRFLAAYETLLEAVSANPQQPLSSLTA